MRGGGGGIDASTDVVGKHADVGDVDAGGVAMAAAVSEAVSANESVIAAAISFGMVA